MKLYFKLLTNIKSNLFSRFGVITAKIARFVKNRTRSTLVYLVINPSVEVDYQSNKSSVEN